MSTVSRLRRFLTVTAVATSNVHKCFHGLEGFLLAPPESWKRHDHYFDCYKDPAPVDNSPRASPATSFAQLQAVDEKSEAPVDDAEDVPNIELDAPADDNDAVVEEFKEEQPIESQFGPIGSQSHRYVSQHMGGPLPKHIVDEPAYFYLWTTYISYSILSMIGHIRDFFGKSFKPTKYKDYMERDGYAALNSSWDNFYFRRLKKRMDDCFGRP